MSRSAEQLPIAVVIPAYNAGSTLSAALASVARQRPGLPAEVIVIDDGSDDDTSRVAAEAGARVIRHERNRGLVAARNSGIAAADSPWVAFLDADDQWLPGHLDTLWSKRDGHVILASTALRCGRLRSRDRLHGSTTGRPLLLSDPARLIYPGNPIPMSASLVRRDVVERVGGFRRPELVEDMDLWLRVLEVGTGLVLPALGAIYSVHAGQLSEETGPMQARHIEVARRYRDRSWYSDVKVERWRGLAEWANVRRALRRRRPLTALRHGGLIASHPQRLYGAIRSSPLRVRAMRESSRVARDGSPSIAILTRDPNVRRHALASGDPRAIVDLSRGLRPLSYLRLIWRPTGRAVTGSRTGSLLLRLAGIAELEGVGERIRARDARAARKKRR